MMRAGLILQLHNITIRTGSTREFFRFRYCMIHLDQICLIICMHIKDVMILLNVVYVSLSG